MFSLTPNAVSHATLAVWGSVLLAGWVGRAGVQAGSSTLAPVAITPPPVETLSIRLETETRNETAAAPAESAEATPENTPPPLNTPPESPAPVTVAPPGATPAFAVAVRGPVTFAATPAAAAANALRHAGTGTGARVAAPVETLTFGSGAGAQPAPNYPREARRKGWEGDVTVRFSVNADGTVAATQVVGASPWFALNDAAENTIRTRWRFAPDRPRVYEITVSFRLTR